MKRKVTVTLLISMMILASLMPTAFAASDCDYKAAGNINDLYQKFYAEAANGSYPQLPNSANQLLSDYMGDPSILQQLKDCQQNSAVNLSDMQSLLDKVKSTAASAQSNPNAPASCPLAPIKPANPVNTPVPSASSAPVQTPAPSATKAPVQTPAPTATKSPAPTATKAPVQTPAPTATKAPVQSSAPNNNASYASDLEKQMVAMVNQERQAAGLPALIIDQGLTASARAHSADMAKNNYFSHTSPTYGSFSQRLKASGISYMSGGENIARYNNVSKAHAGLMNSEGHRANIMNSNYTHIGIGIVWDEDMNAYCITQWFAKLR